jgi:hypothetical protein
MSREEEILSQLLDIHRDYLPSEPPFWPPAPGWWLVIFFSLLLCLLIVFFLYRRLKQQQAKTKFWQEVEQEWQTLKNMVNDEKKFFYYSLFIRKVTKTLYGTAAAALQGQDWLDFLKNTADKDFVLPADFSWEAGIYRPKSSREESWFFIADQWIAQQKCLNKPIHRSRRQKIK